MSANKEWVRIAYCEDIPLREGRAVLVGDREIAVFNLGDRFLAVDNRCPHRGGPLADGIVSGSSVVCPLHGWKIDLQQGNVQRPAETPACVKTFATRVEAGTLLLEVVSEISSCLNSNGHAAVSRDSGSSEIQKECEYEDLGFS
jgi:nitrite reductase (NADH) small subunit